MRLDPLVWFLGFGVVIFALNAWRAAPERPVIDISPETAAIVVQNREALIGARLEPDQAARLIGRFADDEILLREAVAVGLHLQDAKIRARLIDKMEYLLASEAPEPRAEDLADLQASNPMRYKTVKRFSFEHRFFGEDRAAAQEALAVYDAGGPMIAKGPEAFWLGEDMQAYATVQLQTVLGHDFSKSLRDAEPGPWFGPVQSGRGWHLVRLYEVHEPKPLPDADLAARLREDWRALYRQDARDEALERLRQGYEISLPEPGEADYGAALAGGEE
ncbi:MAG: peptidyl-prolyl cis-trans isomerase [Mangrovicoccus sp.]